MVQKKITLSEWQGDKKIILNFKIQQFFSNFKWCWSNELGVAQIQDVNIKLGRLQTAKTKKELESLKNYDFKSFLPVGSPVRRANSFGVFSIWGDK